MLITSDGNSSWVNNDWYKQFVFGMYTFDLKMTLNMASRVYIGKNPINRPKLWKGEGQSWGVSILQFYVQLSNSYNHSAPNSSVRNFSILQTCRLQQIMALGLAVRQLIPIALQKTLQTNVLIHGSMLISPASTNQTVLDKKLGNQILDQNLGWLIKIQRSNVVSLNIQLRI